MTEADRPTIAIDYDEFKPGTYRAVVLTMPGHSPMSLAEGIAPVADLRAAIDVALTAGRPLFMSSVDHFISDLPKASEQREDMSNARDQFTDERED